MPANPGRPAANARARARNECGNSAEREGYTCGLQKPCPVHDAKPPVPVRTSRAPRAGICLSIGGESWHLDGQTCADCGFGLDPRAPLARSGHFGEPIVAPARGLSDHAVPCGWQACAMCRSLGYGLS